MSQGHYTAQVCENGHVVTVFFEDYPESRKSFCDECGAPTITECQNCGANIQGQRREGMPSRNYSAPRYCFECGEPFVWTQKSIEAAEELADELEELSQEEQQSLKDAVVDLVKGGPRSEVAKKRFKRLMSKVGSSSAEAMRNILVDVLSETIKKSLYG